MLLEVAVLVRNAFEGAIIEHAHMELARPTIQDAFSACVARGAKHIIVHPYFLAPGRHSTEDIPRLSAMAAANFPGITHTVTEPLGIDPRMIEVILLRVSKAIVGSNVPR